jgi:hypothetical protein
LGGPESVRAYNSLKQRTCTVEHDGIELCLKLVVLHLLASLFQLLLQFVPLILAKDIKLRENNNNRHWELEMRRETMIV